MVLHVRIICANEALSILSYVVTFVFRLVEINLGCEHSGWTAILLTGIEVVVRSLRVSAD